MPLPSAAPDHCASLSRQVAFSLSHLVPGAMATMVLAFGLQQDSLVLKGMKLPLNCIPPYFWTTWASLEVQFPTGAAYQALLLALDQPST